MTTEQVITHHLEAFGAGDVDEIVADYTDDSVIIVPDATYRGVDAIRGMFGFLFENVFIPGDYDFELTRSEVEGEVAYIVWNASSERMDVPVGTDTFIVRDGKIAVQTFAAHIAPKP